MTRYEQLFRELRNREEGALIPFLTLGDPTIHHSQEILEVLLGAGADMLELGIPFSDPIADGPSIQQASVRALQAGMTTERAFRLIERVRRSHFDVPIGLLIYANLALAYGLNAFYQAAAEAGVDSLLVADLPLEEAEPWLAMAEKYGLSQVFLVTLTSSPERMERIARNSSGYVYLVAALGVTGAREQLQQRALGKIKSLRAVTTKPVCAGFGISQPRHLPPLLVAGADGVVIGSALADIIMQNLDDLQTMFIKVGSWTREMKNETRNWARATKDNRIPKA